MRLLNDRGLALVRNGGHLRTVRLSALSINIGTEEYIIIINGISHRIIVGDACEALAMVRVDFAGEVGAVVDRLFGAHERLAAGTKL